MIFKEWCTKSCVVGTLGLILAGFGTLFIVFWAEIFDHQLASQLILSPESRTYDMWSDPPIPMTLDIYLYNWTNPNDFLNHSTKPILQECGPYVFVEKPEKVNVTWHPENHTVSYMKKSRFYFDAAKSKGSLEDVITSLNVVPLAAAETARHKDFMEKTKVSVGLQIYDQQISVTKLAREFLFEGYEDDLVNAAKELPFLTEGQAVPFDRVGWFYMRNDTANLTGVFNMHTGEGDVMKLGKLMNWNYNSRTDYFKDTCGMINGSAGELYPQKLTKEEPISLFTPDLCRSLPLYFEKEAKVHGLNGFMYSGGERTVDNGTKYPDNWCFCGGECVPSGVLNISACRYGTPVFMSFPHFYGADPFYLNQVEGMKPSEEKHKFFMTMEPTLGIPIDVAARLQLNLLVRPSPRISLYQDVPEVYFPILWFEQRVTMLPSMAKEIEQVFIVPTIGYCVLAVTIVIGLIMIFWFPLATLICAKKFAKEEKTAGGNTKKVAPLDAPDSPLMLKRKDVEMQPVTKQYMFEKPKADTNNDERYA